MIFWRDAYVVLAGKMCSAKTLMNVDAAAGALDHVPVYVVSNSMLYLPGQPPMQFDSVEEAKAYAEATVRLQLGEDAS